MKCPKCKEEIEDNSTFCQFCGEKLNDESSIYCPKCGELTKSNVSFCSKCGYNFKTRKNVSDITYRSPGFILGIIGSTIGLLTLINNGIFLSSFTYVEHCIAIFAGFIGTLYLLKDRRNGAIIMLISAFLFLFFTFFGYGSFFEYYKLACFIIGLGALLVLFKK